MMMVMMMKKIIVVVMVVIIVIMDCLVSREALHTFPSIIISFTQHFFPNHFTHSHTDTHTKCLIKANILIIDDKALYMNLRNTGQSPGGPTDSFHVPRRIPPPLNDSPPLHLLTWDEQCFLPLSWCESKWLYFVKWLWTGWMKGAI